MLRLVFKLRDNYPSYSTENKYSEVKQALPCPFYFYQVAHKKMDLISRCNKRDFDTIFLGLE